MQVCLPDAADLWVHVLAWCIYCDSSDVSRKVSWKWVCRCKGACPDHRGVLQVQSYARPWWPPDFDSNLLLQVSVCPGLMLQIRAGPVARARSWWTFRHTLQVAGRLFAGGPGCASAVKGTL